jgi:hypothetical protein
MIESGFPELSPGSWQGIFVPKGTPKPVINKLFSVVKKVVHDPWVGARHEKVSAPARQATDRRPSSSCDRDDAGPGARGAALVQRRDLDTASSCDIDSRSSILRRTQR